MTSERLLLTGASGFVGSQLLRRLQKRFDLHAVSRSLRQSSDVVWYDLDLLDPVACTQLVRDVRPYYLIHGAWETEHGKFWNSENNLAWLESGKALFSAFHQHGGRRIVACGTCAEYAHSDSALRESDDRRMPTTLYGRSKRELSQFLAELSISSAWARIFYPYGEGENPARFVPSVCLSLLAVDPAEISSGKQIRNFMDVRDVGLAIERLLSSTIEGPINLGTEIPVTIRKVATMLGEISGRPDLIRPGTLPCRPSEPNVLIPDISRQLHELKFEPTITLRTGLSDAFSWWRLQLTEDNGTVLSD